MNSGDRRMTQTLRIDYFADQPSLFCMFCGLQIISEDGVDICPHVLFMAVEEGYEHQSDLVKNFLPPIDIEEDDDEDDDWEAFIARLNEVSGFPPDSFFIESYGTALMPGGLVAGFSPPR